MTSDSLFTVAVADKASEADDIVSFRLVPIDQTVLPAWTPGAHIDVRLPSGLVRQYSLNGDYHDLSSYRIGVLRDPATRGGSLELHTDLEVGTQIRIRPPRNRFELVLADRYLFIAGGIGITPILPMIAQVEELGRPWTLVYGARSRAAMAYLGEIGARSGGDVVLVPQDEAGLLDLETILKQTEAEVVYACGPAALLNALETQEAALRGTERLRVERFSAAPDDVVVVRENRPFELELARTGGVVTVGADETTLDAILERVPDYLYGCQEGYCGTCIANVVSGVPEHRDECLTETERDSNEVMTPCVSRAKSLRLVLDV